MDNTLGAWAFFSSNPAECRVFMERARRQFAAVTVVHVPAADARTIRRGASHRINGRETRVKQRRQSIYDRQQTPEQLTETALERSITRIEKGQSYGRS